MVDAERTQAMDLRDRTQARASSRRSTQGSSSRSTTEPAEGSVDGCLTEGSYEYWFDDWQYSTKFIVTREVFQPGEGWVAEPDRAVLGIEFGWLHSGSGLEWRIDPEDGPEGHGPDGATDAAHGRPHGRGLGDGVWRTFTLTYDVPADALAFTLNFHPKGPGQVARGGHLELPITGDKNHEIPVSFD